MGERKKDGINLRWAGAMLPWKHDLNLWCSLRVCASKVVLMVQWCKMLWKIERIKCFLRIKGKYLGRCSYTGMHEYKIDYFRKLLQKSLLFLSAWGEFPVFKNLMIKLLMFTFLQGLSLKETSVLERLLQALHQAWSGTNDTEKVKSVREKKKNQNKKHSFKVTVLLSKSR